MGIGIPMQRVLRGGRPGGTLWSWAGESTATGAADAQRQTSKRVADPSKLSAGEAPASKGPPIAGPLSLALAEAVSVAVLNASQDDARLRLGVWPREAASASEQARSVAEPAIVVSASNLKAENRCGRVVGLHACRRAVAHDPRTRSPRTRYAHVTPCAGTLIGDPRPGAEGYSPVTLKVL